MNVSKILRLAGLGLLVACSGELPDQVGSDLMSGSDQVASGTLRPTVQIGGEDGAEEYLFGRVADAISVESGIVVLDAQSQEVRLYRRDGDFLRRITGEGDGPGELRQGSFLSKVSDEQFLVVEGAEGSAHLFSSTGDFVRTLSLGGPVEAPLIVDTAEVLHIRLVDRSRVTPEGSDGTVQMIENEGSRVAAPLVIMVLRSSENGEPPKGTVRMTLGGQIVDTVAAPAPNETPVFIQVPQGRILFGFEYQPYAWWKWTAYGHLLVGHTASNAIQRLEPPRFSIADTVVIDRGEIPIVPEERKAILDALFTLTGNRSRDETSVHVPEDAWRHKPLYRRVLATDDGGFWIALHVPSEPRGRPATNELPWYESRTEYFVVGSDGAIEGLVTGPPGIRTLYAEDGMALARTTDALGVHSVVRFEIDWR